jgi:glycosyltransferase involved in cell wall biosynthesis
VILSKSRNYGISKGCELIHQKINNVDYILQLDSDIEFEPENVQRLIAANKDVICAAYQRRDYPEHTCAGTWDDKTGLRFIPWETMGVQKVMFTGCGLQLVKASVFEKLTYPWYCFHTIQTSADDGNTYGYEVGEDIGFAMKCKDAGIDIYVDCDNKVKHLTEWNGRSMENPQKQDTVDLKTFLIYQTAAIDAVKAGIDRVVRDFSQNLANLQKTNEALQTKINELEKPKENAGN